MKDMIIFPEDIERLDGILLPLSSKAKLLLALLINRDGRIITHQGSLGNVDVQSLAALVAGATASTLAIANLVGESEFSAMLHQGRERNIFIDAIDENTYLSVVFDGQTNIDRVKVFIRQFERELKEALYAVYNKSDDQVDLDLDFGNDSFHTFRNEEAFTAYEASGDGAQPSGDAAPPHVSQDAYQYLFNKRKRQPPGG
ncbi:MAG: roadblock/LC7 domain-containing protein [Chitinispirillaceae bacterium]|jgi:predicted regulator of Ras-like GTPase activity (Roadblock/LC7/MglB family)